MFMGQGLQVWMIESIVHCPAKKTSCASIHRLYTILEKAQAYLTLQLRLGVPKLFLVMSYFRFPQMV